MSDERVAILGLGRFGRALGTLTERAGLSWRGYDPASTGASLAEVVAGASLIVLAVPLEALPTALGALGPLVEPAQLVLDTCSVKLAAVSQLTALGAHASWIATHPLFGPASLEPGTPPLRAVICPRTGHEAALERARAYYQRLGCLVVEMSPEAHDRLMARSQALAALLGAGLRELGLDELTGGARSEWLPPSAAPLTALAAAQNAAPGHLRDTILHENPYAKETRSALLAALSGLALPAVREHGDDAAALVALRQAIDEVDLGLLDLLHRRAEIARAISRHKARLGRAVRDPAREASAFAERRAWANARGLDAGFVEQIFDAILHWSRSLQERARGEHD